jgi:hypothetical protein
MFLIGNRSLFLRKTINCITKELQLVSTISSQRIFSLPNLFKNTIKYK